MLKTPSKAILVNEP